MATVELFSTLAANAPSALWPSPYCWTIATVDFLPASFPLLLHKVELVIRIKGKLQTTMAAAADHG